MQGFSGIHADHKSKISDSGKTLGQTKPAFREHCLKVRVWVSGTEAVVDPHHYWAFFFFPKGNSCVNSEKYIALSLFYYPLAIIIILEYLSTGNKLQLLSLGFTYLLPHQGVRLNEEKWERPSPMTTGLLPSLFQVVETLLLETGTIWSALY